ncbi:hypothetical protein CYMTET_17748 [Cymbomonas tetramitiformis]|uniref:peptidylprolyl isomerase n=1 Tax=Cymbomonas tetramitiformis TaxID=36881 RepID=A0AAE0L6N3_9CHLO|nr:hypothetical protein CYMTET_17748 [Cymbomonas tetramitiformis]|eukprot:gene4146-5125_t
MENAKGEVNGGGDVVEVQFWGVGEKRAVPASSGGVMKEVLVAGKGLKTPLTGDVVCVHYVGTLKDNGTKFDSSRDRSVPFTFKLGKGEVIKGWDLGVATMRKGEKCLLTCQPEFAYGNKAQGSIPSNATLCFEVELMSWQSVNEILSGVCLKTLRESAEQGGGGKTTRGYPTDFSTCSVRWLGRTADGMLFEDRTAETTTFNLDEGSVPMGVEEAVRRMKKGMKCALSVDPEQVPEWSKPLGITARSLKGADVVIPKGSAVCYEVELEDWEGERPLDKMSAQGKIDRAEEKKAAGNALFKAAGSNVAVLHRAARRYNAALSAVSGLGYLTDMQAATCNKLMATCQANMAAVLLKLEEWPKVIEACNNVLQHEPDNVKVIFRLGQALLQQKMCVEAADTLRRVIELDPKNREARAALQKAKAQIKEERAKASAVYGKIFREKIVETRAEEAESCRADLGDVESGGTQGALGKELEEGSGATMEACEAYSGNDLEQVLGDVEVQAAEQTGEQLETIQMEVSKGNGEREPQYDVRELGGTAGCSNITEVTILLPNVASMAHVNLDVCEKLMSLKVDGMYKLSLPLMRAVDVDAVAAKFSKKKQTLKVCLSHT